MPIYDTEECYNKILNGLHPPKCTSGIAPEDKWLTTPDMGHIIATCYKRVVVLLTLPAKDICETYFPIRSASPLNPHVNIMCLMCLCLIPGHYLHIILKKGYPLPPSCMEWNNNKIGEARIIILRFWIDNTLSMNSCPRSRSRQINQQMSTIQLFVVILPLRKKRNNTLKSWKKTKIYHHH